MDPVTAALILANTLTLLELRYVDGLTAAQKTERSTRIYDLISRVLDIGDKARAVLHPSDAKPGA